MSDCPTIREREALAHGALPPDATIELREHLGCCSRCRQFASVSDLRGLLERPRLTLADADWERVWSVVRLEIDAHPRHSLWSRVLRWFAAPRLIPAGLAIAVLVVGLFPIYRSRTAPLVEVLGRGADETQGVAVDSPGFAYLSNPTAAVGHILVAGEGDVVATITVTMVIDERLADLF